jgi:cellulose synthase (UDP-forming)
MTALGAGAFYLTWRVSTIDGTGALGVAFYAVEVLNFALLALTAFLFWRVRVRPGPPAPPAGRLDVFITVCGEPVELVEESLRAALSIAYPHGTHLLNDGRLAGKSNWQEIDQLAARYDVPCHTRTTGLRGKAGNLNHALAQTTADYVAVIDCDHDAGSAFAHELLGYFTDPKVGFVTTRQEFYGDRSDLLGTREPLFFSWFQPAKDAAKAAISTGSGVIYRRAALDSVGGFSEWSIVEDFHTSTRMHAAGWTSVYHPRPVTIGIAPGTAAALVKQRLTWATDSTRVLFYDNPLTKRGLSAAQRLHHFHTGFYYVVACTQLFFLLSPALWLIWQIPVMSPPSAESYLVHSLPAAAATFALLIIWGGQRGIRAVQQQFYLAPVFLFGVARAATGVRYRSGVTDKVLQSRFSPLTLPQLLIAALLVVALVTAFVRPGDGQAVAAAWAAFMAYSLIAFITTFSGRAGVDRALRIALRAGIVLLAVLVVLPLPDRLRPDSAAEAALSWDGPRQSLAAPDAGAYLGVFDPLILQSPDGLTQWNAAHGAQARVVHFYQQWFGDGERGFPAETAATVADQGAVPLITWEPLGGTSSSTTGGGGATILADIVAGRHDEYIRSWARDAAAFGRPVLVRPLHDMNGSWYPWSVGTGSNSPQLFVEAWRHLHDLFQAESATNVGWVWSVYSFEEAESAELARLYPGSGYADWVSMAAFNWGEGNDSAWRTMDELFSDTYDALSGLGKPVMISQIATADLGGDPAAWTREALRGFRDDYPLVKAVVWYDARYSDEVDLRIRGATAAAFASELAASAYWSPEPVIVQAPAEPESA